MTAHFAAGMLISSSCVICAPPRPALAQKPCQGGLAKVLVVLRRFEVHRAETVEEAIDLRRRFGADAAVYAGGTELLLAMKLGVARWPHLIDVKPIRSLGSVQAGDGSIRIGATVTHWALERDPTVARAFPALAALERNVANI